MSVGDVAGGPIGDLPADAAVANFGELQRDPAWADKGAALGFCKVNPAL